MRAYSRMQCWFCKKVISTGGYANHMRKHVREGMVNERVLELKDGTIYRSFEKRKNGKA